MPVRFSQMERVEGNRLRDPETGDFYDYLGVNPSTGKVRLKPVAVDTESGAPFGERARASFGGWDPSDQLREWESIRGKGNARVGKDGESIEVLDGGQWKRVDPSGLDVGDLADIPGKLPEVAASVAGAGLLAAGAATPPGMLALGALGAGAGAAGGDVLRQAADVLLPGGGEKKGVGERAQDVVQAGAYGAAGEAAAGLLAPVVRGAARRIGKPVLEAVTGVPGEHMAKLAGKEGERIYPLIGKTDDALAETATDIQAAIGDYRTKAQSAFRQKFDAIFPKDAPFNTAGAIDEWRGIQHEFRLVDDAGTPREAMPKTSMLNAAGERMTVDEALASIDSTASAVDVRQALDDLIKYRGQGVADPVGSKAQGALRALRTRLEKAIEGQATAAGVGQQYKALKSEYGQAMRRFKNLRGYFTDPRAEGTVRNIESVAKRKVREDLESVATYIPEHAETIQRASDIAAARSFEPFIPRNKMDISRGALGVLAGGAASNPLAAGLLYAGTRPAAIKYPLYYGGKAARAAGGLLERAAPTAAKGGLLNDAVPTVERAGFDAVDEPIAVGARFAREGDARTQFIEQAKAHLRNAARAARRGDTKTATEGRAQAKAIFDQLGIDIAEVEAQAARGPAQATMFDEVGQAPESKRAWQGSLFEQPAQKPAQRATVEPAAPEPTANATAVPTAAAAERRAAALAEADRMEAPYQAWYKGKQAGEHAPPDVVEQYRAGRALRKQAWEQHPPEPDAAGFYNPEDFGVEPWQTSEAGFVDRYRQKRLRNLQRGVEQEAAALEKLRPGTAKHTQAEANRRYWQGEIDRINAGDTKMVDEKAQREYFETVKKAISSGKPVPEAVIRQRPEFLKAQTARARYDKGRHTSFANESAAVSHELKRDRGIKIKRQDGKAMTPEHVKDVVEALDDIEAAVGPLHDLFDKTNLTIAHTGAKNPFMSKAAGMYHSTDRTVSVGGNFPAAAHEIGHWLDFEAGKLSKYDAPVFSRSTRKVTARITSAAQAEARGASAAAGLIERARLAMNDRYGAQKIASMSWEDIGKLPAADAARVKALKQHLGPYYNEPAEIWARMFEQYVATKHAGKPIRSLSHSGSDWLSRTPAYWSETQFAEMMPQIEAEIARRMDSLRGGTPIPPRAEPYVRAADLPENVRFKRDTYTPSYGIDPGDREYDDFARSAAASRQGVAESLRGAVGDTGFIVERSTATLPDSAEAVRANFGGDFDAARRQMIHHDVVNVGGDEGARSIEQKLWDTFKGQAGAVVTEDRSQWLRSYGAVGRRVVAKDVRTGKMLATVDVLSPQEYIAKAVAVKPRETATRLFGAPDWEMHDDVRNTFAAFLEAKTAAGKLPAARAQDVARQLAAAPERDREAIARKVLGEISPASSINMPTPTGAGAGPSYLREEPPPSGRGITAQGTPPKSKNIVSVGNSPSQAGGSQFPGEVPLRSARESFTKSSFAKRPFDNTSVPPSFGGRKEPRFRREGAVGHETTARGPDPREQFTFRYRVVDLGDLTVSHDRNFRPNTKYAQELQPRDRTRAAYKQQVDEIVGNLNSDELLTDTKTLDRGIPIVGPDGMVESGNGRLMALREVAGRRPPKWREYQETMRNRLSQYGIDPSDVEGMKRPVLVRERVGEVDRARFAEIANQTSMAGRSEIEATTRDAAALADQALTALEPGAIGAAGGDVLRRNKDVGRAFLSAVPRADRAALVDAGGALSKRGVERLRNTVFAKTYTGEEGQELFRVLAEAADDEARGLQTALVNSLPDVARLEANVRLGKVDAAYGVADDVAKVSRKLLELRRAGQSVDEFVGQGAMFGRDLSPVQEVLLRYFDANKRAPARIDEFLRVYAEKAASVPPPTQGSMFGAERVTRRELLMQTASEMVERYPESRAGKAAAAAQDGLAQASDEAAAPVPTAARAETGGPAAETPRPEAPEGASAEPPPDWMGAPAEEEKRWMADTADDWYAAWVEKPKGAHHVKMPAAADLEGREVSRGVQAPEGYTEPPPRPQPKERTAAARTGPKEPSYATALDVVYDEVARAKRRFPGVKVELLRQHQQGVKGYIKDGTVYVNPFAVMGAEDLRKTILHEVVGHQGVTETMGKEFERTLQRVNRRYPAQTLKIERELGAFYKARGTKKTPAALKTEAAEEYLAELAETYNPVGFLAEVYGRLREVAAKKFDVKLTDRDVQFLLTRAGTRMEGFTPYRHAGAGAAAGVMAQ